jgi:hypothetical protein
MGWVFVMPNMATVVIVATAHQMDFLGFIWIRCACIYTRDI